MSLLPPVQMGAGSFRKGAQNRVQGSYLSLLAPTTSVCRAGSPHVSISLSLFLWGDDEEGKYFLEPAVSGIERLRAEESGWGSVSELPLGSPRLSFSFSLGTQREGRGSRCPRGWERVWERYEEKGFCSRRVCGGGKAVLPVILRFWL